jgi:exodeoxyribonuclease-1
LNDADKLRVQTVAAAGEKDLADFHPNFGDERLDPLLLHYKARNFPRALSSSETDQWEQWRVAHLQKQLPGFVKSMERLSKQKLTDNQEYVLQELQLWLESIAPSDTSEATENRQM